MKNRYYNFLCLGYPESINPDFETILSEEFQFCYILHDKDTNDDGELKKPHYHFILHRSMQMTFTAFKLLVDSLKIGLVVPPNENDCCVHSKSLAERYLDHSSNLDKYQYSRNDIVLCNGYELGSDSNKKAIQDKERQDLLVSIIKRIHNQEFNSFDEVYMIVACEFPEHLVWLSSKAFLINAMFKSVSENNLKTNLFDNF